VNPAAPTRHSALEYRPAIDGLRALAVLSVFVFHLNHAWLPGGFLGVDVFFVISGYLITSIIFKECGDGSFHLTKFYQRRIARIFPAFFAVALATLAGARFIYLPQDLASAGANLAAAALSVTNLKLMFQGNYFAVSPDAQPYLHYWTLSVEEQFYVFFPLLLLLIFKYARRHLVRVLAALAVLSFATAVLIAPWRPVWAFYLLPTRAWELLAGCLLAVTTDPARPAPEARWRNWLTGFGLAVILLSMAFIGERARHPEFWMLLPVAGAVAVLFPAGAARGGRWLTAAPLVFVGRISYSLYLWHWPVLSLVDFDLYLASEPVRLALKIGLSFLAAVASFSFIENPARRFLNDRKNTVLAYAAMVGAVALCVSLGMSVRRANYINAESRDVARGGLVFPAHRSSHTVVLMGDSNGSMYGKTLRELCAQTDCRLVVISVAAGDPLPELDATSGRLWLDSLAVVKKEQPDCLVLACSWMDQLREHRERLALAVGILRTHVGRLVILNQPPLLPENATRQAIRQGVRPPFFEDPEIQRRRRAANAYLKGFDSGNCSVIDIASHFQGTNGEVLFLDDQGRQLYHDFGHLSGVGVNQIREVLRQACFVPPRGTRRSLPPRVEMGLIGGLFPAPHPMVPPAPARAASSPEMAGRG